MIIFIYLDSLADIRIGLALIGLGFEESVCCGFNIWRAYFEIALQHRIQIWLVLNKRIWAPANSDLRKITVKCWISIHVVASKYKGELRNDVVLHINKLHRLMLSVTEFSKAFHLPEWAWITKIYLNPHSFIIRWGCNGLRKQIIWRTDTISRKL